MTPEAIDARLRLASDLSRALVGKPGPQAVSMAPAAVSARLHEWAELTRMCLMLARDVRLPPAAADTASVPHNGEGPER